jgi:hypothetical protein
MVLLQKKNYQCQLGQGEYASCTVLHRISGTVQNLVYVHAVAKPATTLGGLRWGLMAPPAVGGL